MDEMGYCNIVIEGPEYCSYFQWDAPDISGEDIQLTGYNIYYYYTEEYEEGMEIPSSEIVLIAHTTDNNLYLKGSYTGIAWVTALYSDEESAPSNIDMDMEPRPIDVQNIKSPKFVLYYNRQQESIEIKGIENIVSIALFRTDGTKVMDISSSDNHFITVKNLEKGIYIIQITTKDSQTVSEKVVIE